jgi:hypothetical protein
MIAKIVPKSSRNIFAVEGTLLYAAITAIFLFSPEYRTNSRNQISLMCVCTKLSDRDARPIILGVASRLCSVRGINVEKVVLPLEHLCKDVASTIVTIGALSGPALAPRQVVVTLTSTSTSTELTNPPPTVVGNTTNFIADRIVISISSTTTLFPEPPPTPVQLPGTSVSVSTVVPEVTVIIEGSPQSGGLSRSDIIALGVGIGIGVPACVAALVTVCLMADNDR